MEQRRRHAAGDRQPADEVAEGGTLLERGTLGRSEPIRHAAARPERDAVIAAAPGIGPATPLAMTARVDDARIDRTHVLVAEPQPLARRVQKGRDQHVVRAQQALQDGVAVGMRQVEPEAALVPAEMLDEEIAPRGARDEAGGDEAADGIAVTGMLDLRDLRPPVTENRGR